MDIGKSTEMESILVDEKRQVTANLKESTGFTLELEIKWWLYNLVTVL